MTRYIVLPTIVVFALGLGAGWELHSWSNRRAHAHVQTMGTELCASFDADDRMVPAPCAPWPAGTCRYEPGDSIGGDLNSDRMWVERNGKTICRGRGIEPQRVALPSAVRP